LLPRPKKASGTGNFELWNSTNAVDAPQIIGAWADEALATSSLHIFSAFGLQIPVETICRPLRDSLQYTRLLALFRTQDRQIRCCLDEVPLFDLPDYTAFSYCWGSLADTGLFLSTIKVSTSDEISERLHYLKISRVWVEALCINQRGQPGKGTPSATHENYLLKGHGCDCMDWQIF
jgi:Heterokaryon incompatibility protein (HET)